MKADQKKKVLAHLKEDTKEFKKQMKDDMSLKKVIAKKPKKMKKGKEEKS